MFCVRLYSWKFALQASCLVQKHLFQVLDAIGMRILMNV